ncbi:hypothetical protein GPECTOR_1g617 [Gonium pectorale]|uniref:SAM-dependent MTase RsmB/NOP-type domain-containing protein n=1 Tax=Gonium pectorale TaxID=33097 RepID=A0A150H3S8_GONPE|nr:hypothetical protein GPECTOR_1g617 [Gonium pectorale]|eukprot:KXZ56685.1 hypothetical protein GPECTOR_1g617 [Gonium pectorale]
MCSNSIEPEEDSEQVEAFLDRHPGFEVEHAGELLRGGAAGVGRDGGRRGRAGAGADGGDGGGARLGVVPSEVVTPEGFVATLPHVHDTDGAFAVRLRRLCSSLPAPTEDQPQQRRAAASCPLSLGQAALLHALASAAAAHCCGLGGATTSGSGSACSADPSAFVQDAAEVAWAVAQLLWACGRTQYWHGPPERATHGSGPQLDGACGCGSQAGPTASGSGPGREPGVDRWPSLEVLSIGGAGAGQEGAGPSAACRPAQAALGDVCLGPRASASPLRADPPAPAHASASAGSSAGPRRPLAVSLFVLLAADGCRLVGALDPRSACMVWWALGRACASAWGALQPPSSPSSLSSPAKASNALAGRHLPPSAAASSAAAAAAAAAVESVPLALLAALERRAVALLPDCDVAQLASLMHSCAMVAAGWRGRAPEGLLPALADEIAGRLERCALTSELSCFMYGLAHCGAAPPDDLLDWAAAAITALPPAAFSCRHISLLITHFHKTRSWSRVAAAAEHLLTAVTAVPPPAVPLPSVCALLMGMGGGRVRHEGALAHLCAALVCHPAEGLSAKDVCICLTALQRLHGDNVLVSQLPETLAAVDHLTAAIAGQGFSRGGDAPGSAPVPVFNHQEVSNAVFALGKLRFYSPAVLAALEDHAARGGFAGSSPWDCSAILSGLAVLDYGLPRGQQRQQPCGADLVGVLVDIVASRAGSAKSQDLVNTLWALSTLEGALERYRTGVVVLVEEVNRRGPSGCSVDEHRQLWQVHRELSELPAPFTAISEPLQRVARLGMSEADHTYSRVQVGRGARRCSAAQSVGKAAR